MLLLLVCVSAFGLLLMAATLNIKGPRHSWCDPLNVAGLRIELRTSGL